MTYIQPVLPLVIAILAVAIWRGKKWRGRRIAAVAVALLFVWSWEPVAYVLAGTLEWRYPVRQFPAEDAEAIVVLSGGAYEHDASQPEDLPQMDTYVRCSYASWLFRNWRKLPIVVSGGVTHGPPPVVLADVMQKVLVEQGVPASMIWSEQRSHSTYENALWSAALLRGRGVRRIALVTEAHHMLRAERAFRRQGLMVTPAPCAYLTQQFKSHWDHFVPNVKAIERSELILHEWLGVLWYRMSGRI